GVALFVGSSALSLRLCGGRVLLPRLAVVALMLVALAVTAPLQPVWPLVVVAVALLTIVVVEGAGPEPA
ncbi:MAG: hypothetical protein ACRDIL_17645, partial [Candidatus Limnocylindrales bacterium]